MGSSNDLSYFLIGSGAGFSIGFISGILFALNAPDPKEIILENLYRAMIEIIKSIPMEAQVIGIFIFAITLVFALFKLQEILEIFAGGIVCFVLGFIAGMLIVSNIEVLVLIAVIILWIVRYFGWLKK